MYAPNRQTHRHKWIATFSRLITRASKFKLKWNTTKPSNDRNDAKMNAIPIGSAPTFTNQHSKHIKNVHVFFLFSPFISFPRRSLTKQFTLWIHFNHRQFSAYMIGIGKIENCIPMFSLSLLFFGLILSAYTSRNASNIIHVTNLVLEVQIFNMFHVSHSTVFRRCVYFDPTGIHQIHRWTCFTFHSKFASVLVQLLVGFHRIFLLDEICLQLAFFEITAKRFLCIRTINLLSKVIALCFESNNANLFDVFAISIGFYGKCISLDQTVATQQYFSRWMPFFLQAATPLRSRISQLYQTKLHTYRIANILDNSAWRIRLKP